MSRHAGEFICWELREQLNFQAIAPLAARIHADQLGGNSQPIFLCYHGAEY
jgi:hypothetical protein